MWGVWLKTFALFFRPHPWQLQRLSLVGLLGEGWSSHWRHSAQPVCCCPEGTCTPGLRPPYQSFSLHICILSPGAFTPRPLYLRLWTQVFAKSLGWDLLVGWGRVWNRGKEKRELKDTIPLSKWEYFSLSALPPCPLLDHKAHKNSQAVSSGLPQQGDPPIPVLIHLTLDQCPHFMEENRTKKSALYLILESYFYHHNKWLNACL